MGGVKWGPRHPGWCPPRNAAANSPPETLSVVLGCRKAVFGVRLLPGGSRRAFCSDSFCISCRVAVLERSPSLREAHALQTPGHGQPPRPFGETSLYGRKREKSRLLGLGLSSPRGLGHACQVTVHSVRSVLGVCDLLRFTPPPPRWAVLPRGAPRS